MFLLVIVIPSYLQNKFGPFGITETKLDPIKLATPFLNLLNYTRLNVLSS